MSENDLASTIQLALNRFALAITGQIFSSVAMKNTVEVCVGDQVFYVTVKEIT